MMGDQEDGRSPSGPLARVERFLSWDALSPIALGALLVSLDAGLFQSICVLVVFVQYSVKIDQIHAQAIEARRAAPQPSQSTIIPLKEEG